MQEPEPLTNRTLLLPESDLTLARKRCRWRSSSERIARTQRRFAQNGTSRARQIGLSVAGDWL
jgi:hypothetical protein